MAPIKAKAPATASTVNQGRELVLLGGTNGFLASPDKPQNQPERIRYVLTLVPRPGVNGVYAVRGLLKVAGRRFGLKCTSVEQVRQ